MIRIANWQASALSNPYSHFFYNALSRRGIKLVGEFELKDAWLRVNAGNVDVIHFQWPESAWRASGKVRWLLKLRKLLGFWRFLQLAKKLGYIVVWTMHEVGHHEGSDWIDQLGYFILIQHSNIIISHSQSESAEIMHKYPDAKQKIVVVYHGIYEDYYSESTSVVKVRETLGLKPEIKTVACLGYLRQYKGLDIACEAVRYLSDVQFIIAGEPRYEYDMSQIMDAKAKIGERMVTILRELSSEEFADIAAAADIILLPYRKITTSGLLLTVLGLGKPVVVTDLSYFHEILQSEPEAAVFVKNNDPMALAEGIKKMFFRDLGLSRQAVLRLSQKYSWNQTVLPFAERLFELMKD